MIVTLAGDSRNLRAREQWRRVQAREAVDAITDDELSIRFLKEAFAMPHPLEMDTVGEFWGGDAA